jgi:phage baseplate assembly protein W
MDARKFLGTPYPITKDPGGFLHTEYGVRKIKADILSLLLTNPGERVMLPSYGTPLKKLFFEPNDSIVRSQAKSMIAASISRFEPRIRISQIEISTIKDTDLNYLDDKSNKESILYIKILFFDPNDIKTVQSLTLNLPMTNQ